MFTATVSRPDIAHAVNELAQYSTNPSLVHWNLAKNLLQFLFYSRDQKLTLAAILIYMRIQMQISLATPQTENLLAVMLCF